MLKHLTVAVLGIMLIGLTGCKLQTPEVRGVVLDAETKEPVEGAWVSATIGVKTKTMAGDVGQVVSIEPPHLRTGKDGKFTIPVRELKKPTFPLGFGTEVDEFIVNGVTLDKSGSSKLDTKLLRKEKIEVTVYVEDVEKVMRKHLQHYPPERFEYGREMEEFSGLQGLYTYCLTGRSSIEIYIEPPGGCDDWELNFAITLHERYLERFPKTDETRSHVSIIFEQLGLLYDRKGEYEKAIENLKKAKEIRFFRPQDIDVEINRIQQKLQQKQK